MMKQRQTAKISWQCVHKHKGTVKKTTTLECEQQNSSLRQSAPQPQHDKQQTQREKKCSYWNMKMKDKVLPEQ